MHTRVYVALPLHAIIAHSSEHLVQCIAVYLCCCIVEEVAPTLGVYVEEPAMRTQTCQLCYAMRTQTCQLCYAEVSE